MTFIPEKCNGTCNAYSARIGDPGSGNGEPCTCGFWKGAQTGRMEASKPNISGPIRTVCPGDGQVLSILSGETPSPEPMFTGAILRKDPVVSIDGDVFAKDCEFSFSDDLPLKWEGGPVIGRVEAITEREFGITAEFKITDDDMYQRMLGWRADMRASMMFTASKTVIEPDPAMRAPRTLRGVLRQMRDIVAYDYACARDGKRPQRTTTVSNLKPTSMTLITGLTS